ncbi:MAG: hypothetical protein ACK5JT_10075, partial [Hyphomicrobiaceae bacterium]
MPANDERSFRPVALVTGAASGIGAATSKAIAGRCRGLALHTRGANHESIQRLNAVGDVAKSAGAQ